MSVSSSRPVLRVGYLIAVGAVTFLVSYLVQEKYYSWAAALTLILILLAIADALDLPKRSLLADTHTLNQWVVGKVIAHKTADEVRGRLERLYGALAFDQTSEVHLAVHLPIRAFNSQGIHSDWLLLQITDYVGPRKRGKNRIVSAHKGIVGRAFRTQLPQIANFDDRDDYFTRMTNEFGFFPNEANYHSTEARSYLCMPFGLEGGDSPLLVLYLYSTSPGFFSETQIEDNAHVYREACSDVANCLATDKLVSKARTQ